MKKLISLGMGLIMVLGLSASIFASQYTMSWDFELYNKPYAESIALSLAQAQKGLEKDPYDWRDPIQNFKDTLTRQIFYKITRNIIDEAFGEGELEPGHYVAGDFTIDILTDGVTITVIITDILTGDTTTIEVPYYDYGG